MNCGFVDTAKLAKSELREDVLDIVLTRLSGVAYHMHGLSRASTVRGMKETAESLMESEDRAKGILDPSECYEVGLTFHEDLLQNEWTLRDAGLQSGDTVSVLCKKGTLVGLGVVEEKPWLHQ